MSAGRNTDTRFTLHCYLLVLPCAGVHRTRKLAFGSLNAKMLRRSDSARNVYINRNLSKEEARLAYEARCRRRERQQQSQGRQRQHESPRASASLSAGAAESVPAIAATAVSATIDATTSGAVDGGVLSGRHR